MDTETIPTQPRKPAWLRLFALLLTAFLVMIACTAISIGYTVHRYWENVLVAEITRSLTQKAQMFASRLSTERQRPIGELTSQIGQQAGARATVIDTNGNVVADSEIAVASLEGDGRHPEFAAALRGEIGFDKRKRNAFGIPVLYVAVPVPGGAVRLAYPLSDIAIAISQARKTILIGSLTASLAALAVSAIAATTIVKSAPSPQ
jgi:two-component system, OmpR family, phosphate regulon sensor histidine kinase PhoR